MIRLVIRFRGNCRDAIGYLGRNNMLIVASSPLIPGVGYLWNLGLAVISVDVHMWAVWWFCSTKFRAEEYQVRTDLQWQNVLYLPNEDSGLSLEGSQRRWISPLTPRSRDLGVKDVLLVVYAELAMAVLVGDTYLSGIRNAFWNTAMWYGVPNPWYPGFPWGGKTRKLDCLFSARCLLDGQIVRFRSWSSAGWHLHMAGRKAINHVLRWRFGVTNHNSNQP